MTNKKKVQILFLFNLFQNIFIMYYITIDDHSSHPNSISCRKICLNIIKRLFRSKLIILLVIIFFTLLIYSKITEILSSQSDLNEPEKNQLDELSNLNMVSLF